MNARVLRASLLGWAVALGSAAGQTDPEAESRFEKFEFRIPMRDVVRLYSAVYVPRDGSARSPILMYRTRYGVGHYGANVYPPLRELAWPGFTGRPYIFVWQARRASRIHPVTALRYE